MCKVTLEEKKAINRPHQAIGGPGKTGKNAPMSPTKSKTNPIVNKKILKK